MAAVERGEELDGKNDGRRRTSRLTTMASSRTARAVFVAQHRRWIRDAMTSLWFKPAIAMLCALTIGAIVSGVHVDESSWLWPFTFHGDASDARQLLVVITGTMITTTSLVFALTVVSLQIASTQFSPRLLRSFLRDPGTQLVLSGFVGTVSFSLAGLFTVGTGNAFVPRVAVTVALAWALMCVGLLVYYIGHITNAIRIDSVMRRVEIATRRTLRRDHPVVDPRVSDPDATVVLPTLPGAVTIKSQRDGYLQGIDARLLTLADRKRISVALIPLIGHHVVAGRELAVAWPDDGEHITATLMVSVANLIDIESERRIERDVGLGLRQLVDIVNRAMSTGQNDPYTATQAVHHLTSVLDDASRRSFATIVVYDKDGMPRVLLPVMSFATHMKVVCGHIRQGGLERHPRVTLELLRMLGSLAESSISRPRLRSLRRETDLLMADASRMIQTGADLDEALDLGNEVLAILDRREAVTAKPIRSAV